MKDAIWLSYDLGVSGDYEGMYSWLDNHDARECGSSTAFLKFSHQGDLMEDLKKEISDNVELKKRSRIYVAHERDGKLRGRFLIGRRKGAPWEGYGNQGVVEEDTGDA